MTKTIQTVKNYVVDHHVELFQMGMMAAVIVVPMMMGGSCEAATTAGSSDGASSLPWNKGINTLGNELTGPLPRIGATIAVAVAGGMMAFGEMNGITKRAMQGVFGLGTAIGAANLVQVITGATSGLLF